MRIEERKRSAPESPLDHLIIWTEFPDQYARSKKPRASSLRELAERIPRTTGKTKEELPWLKLAEFGDEPKSKRTGCLRHGANMIAIHGVELDFDKGDPTWDQVWSRLWEAGTPALLYTTRRHSEDTHRFRILLPTSRPLLPAERAQLVARVYGVVRGKIDGASFTDAQAFYFGSPDGVRVFVELVDPPGGQFIDLANDLDSGALNKKGEPWEARNRGLSTYADAEDNEDTGTLDGTPNIEKIRSELFSIPAPRWDNDYNEWLAVGQGLHQGFNGSAEGMALWDEASKRCATYDREELEFKWRTFGDYSGKPITLRTIHRLARIAGEDMDIARLNRRHAIVAIRGRTLVATEGKDGGTDFGPVQDLHNYYANDRVAVSDKRTEEVSRRWMHHPNRRTYPNGVVFAPGGAPAGTLNLFRGWAVEPNSDASCSLFLKHVQEVVCKGNADHANYVLGWMAHIVQRPDEKPGVALVLRGPKGAGKDKIAEYLARMIGHRHAPTVANSDHIVGKFNQRMESALLLHVQEGSWAGDRKAEEVLKYLVTSPFVEIERKGVDSINLPSVLRMFISANAEWVVPASRDERRWAVFDVSDARRGDDAHFAALRAEMDGDGPAALLDFLQTYDLTAFNVRHAPETDGLLNQKLASLRGIHKWWFESLSSGEVGSNFLTKPWEDGWQFVDCDELRGGYISYMRNRRFDGDPLDAATFGKQLREMLPSIAHKRRGGRVRRAYAYNLPPLPLARRAFEKWIGSPVDWDALQ